MISGPIVLLTDFGHEDPFVGVMKGVILSHAPKCQMVDLCHEVPAQDIRTGAFHLRAAVPFFPRGALFVAVVDPGVGSSRRILWARSARHQFLAPDNGILSWIAEPLSEIRAVTESKLWPPASSATFQGRDIFAPVAGRLKAGLSPRALGPETRETLRLPFPAPRRARGGLAGEIIAIDHFGNAVTNLAPGDCARVRFRGRELGSVRTHYATAKEGEAIAIAGSSGFVELAVRNGHFARRFKARSGDRVESRD